jgi:uncharacterized coiled-coil protein SlyX
MAEKERDTAGAGPGPVQEWLDQLRGMTEAWQKAAGFGPAASQGPGTLPLPAAFSAEQLTAIADSVAEQRRSIEALQAQLSAFDENLALLEQALDPLAEWSKAWAELEQRMLNLGGKSPPRPGAS